MVKVLLVWSENRLVNINTGSSVVLLPKDSIRTSHNGELTNTHSKHVVCLGGGKCVEEEFRNANKDVLFDVFPMNRIVVREKKDLLTKEKSLNDEKKQNDGIVTSIVEETSLLQFANEKNMNIYN